jgi:hypothetical protein
MGAPYTRRISADVLVFAGICTVKVDVDVLFEPKSNTHTAPLSPGVYIRAPRAVIAPVQDGEEKVMYVVLPNEVASVDMVAVTS